MRPQDIVIGEWYRFHDHPNYSWFKAIRVLKAKEHPNPHTYAVVEGHHSVDKDETWCLVKHYRPCDLVRSKT